MSGAANKRRRKAAAEAAKAASREDEGWYWFDGAHVGLTCAQCVAIKRSGMKVPTERMSAAEMRAYLEAADDVVSLTRYDDVGLGEFENQSGEMSYDEALNLVAVGPNLLTVSEGAVDLTMSQVYGDVARSASKAILRFMEAHPEHAERWPSLPFHRFIGHTDEAETIDAAMRASGDYAYIETLRLTGFQFGWALNAARFVLGMTPVPNPALTRMTEQQIRVFSHFVSNPGSLN